jgi:putative phage abortive infection protein
MELEDIDNRVKNSFIFAVSVIFAVPFSYFVWFYIKNGYSISLDTATWGTFGDYMGGILSPLIAFLAFYWLTQSVLIQKTELRDTKNALEESSEAQKEQVITQEKKRFEDTFFSLLEQHNKVLDQLHEITSIHGKPQPSNIENIKQLVLPAKGVSIESARDMLHNNFNHVCGHYFRILYQLLKLIAVNCYSSEISKEFTREEITSKIVTDEEKFYSNIVRSFLSFDMTMLLAVNCICDDPKNTYYKYRLLIERYNFLEHMPLRNNLIKETIEKYDEKAFGQSDFLARYRAKITDGTA